MSAATTYRLLDRIYYGSRICCQSRTEQGKSGFSMSSLIANQILPLNILKKDISEGFL